VVVRSPRGTINWRPQQLSALYFRPRTVSWRNPCSRRFGASPGRGRRAHARNGFDHVLASKFFFSLPARTFLTMWDGETVSDQGRGLFPFPWRGGRCAPLVFHHPLCCFDGGLGTLFFPLVPGHFCGPMRRSAEVMPPPRSDRSVPGPWSVNAADDREIVKSRRKPGFSCPRMLDWLARPPARYEGWTLFSERPEPAEPNLSPGKCWQYNRETGRLTWSKAVRSLRRAACGADGNGGCRVFLAAIPSFPICCVVRPLGRTCWSVCAR